MRFGISVSVGLLVTLALFYLMQAMISGRGQNIDTPANYAVVDFVRLHRTPVETTTEALQRVDPQKPLPAPNMLPFATINSAAGPPPTAVDHSASASDPTDLMQLGKPYLEPLTVAVQKPVPTQKPVSNSELKRAAKAQPQRNAVVQAAEVVSARSKGMPAALEQPQQSVRPTASGGLTRPVPGQGVDADSEAVAVFTVEPRYPRKAARRRIEGWVKVAFTITEQGTVTDPVVVDSRPRSTFDRSAIQSIRKWRFKPKLIDGKAVQRKATQIIKFKLAKG